MTVRRIAEMRNDGNEVGSKWKNESGEERWGTRINK